MLLLLVNLFKGMPTILNLLIGAVLGTGLFFGLDKTLPEDYNSIGKDDETV